ncbi:hypothetical protein [Microlunatus antarcticus]|uniref:Uncharacterized protein n=1 Tax=Microlunatus antarcticus TaxID=53388 RepID=A0A7W5JS90_9ACTN|nr:hypothetical protein [Microlunatus antarcticus]MBB3325380.1 hypothetical protein [Microlunatus antarcticus]
MDDDIPALLPLHQVAPLRTQADLHHQWRAMMGPLGFGSRRLWLLFLDPDDRPTELLMQIDDIPDVPREGETDSLLRLCHEVRREHGLGRVAVLLSRPGEGPVRASDRRWGRALLASGRRLDVPLAPLHLAHDAAVVPLAGDDLLAVV